MEVWGPARVRGQGHERYFLLVIDDNSHYTTVFPLPRKGEVSEVLINWIRDRGGEFSSDLLRAFCRGEGIRQMFTLSSPQQNGIAERRIGMVMDVARMSMIHAAAPHFMWPFAVQYAAHQINLQPRVSLPETTLALRWTRKVCDASVFCVFRSRAFVRDTSADKLSSHAVPCVFLGFPPDAPGWLFYHPTSRRVLSSQDVTFNEPPPPSGVSQVDAVEVAVDSGTARGAEPAGAGPGGAEPWVAESEGAEPGGVDPERVEHGGPLGVPSQREPLSPQRLREWYARCCSHAAGATGPVARGASEARAAGGAAGAGAARAAGPGGAGAGGIGAVGSPAGVGAAGGAGAAGPGGACTRGTRAARAGGAARVGAVGAGAVALGGAAGGTGAGGAAGVVARDPGAEDTGAVSAVSGGAAWPRPYYVPLLQQVLGLLPSTGPTPPLQSPPPVQSQSKLQPASPLPGPSPYSGATRGLTEHREPKSRAASPDSLPASLESCPESPVRAVRTGRRVLRQRPPSVPGTHSMTLRLSTAPQCVPLPSPPASCLPDTPDRESDSLRTAIPSLTRFLATAVTEPSFESTAASALVAELVDFAAACCLDYLASLVAESKSASVCPPSVGSECALGTDVLEDRHEEFECFASPLPHLMSMLLAPEGDQDAPDIPNPRSYAEAIEGPYSSPWQTAMETKMASWKSTGTYVDEVPPPGANIWHDTLRRTLAALGFAPSTADPSLFLRTDTTLPPFYVLVYVDDLVFATADTEALAHVKSELQKRHMCPVLAPPSDESVEPSGPYPELVGCLIYLMTCTRPDLAYPLSILARYVTPGRHRKEHKDATKRVLRYLCSTSGMGLVLGGQARVVLTGHADACWVDDLATQRSSQGYTFSLGSGSVSWRSTRSSSVLSSSCEAEICAGAMAAQELRWLTYLLTDLGEAPRSPPVLYVDNKAMLALCQEHILEHRTKHIAQRYFLA
ncbi:unnamed protein product [Closterium sp. NIES-54]